MKRLSLTLLILLTSASALLAQSTTTIDKLTPAPALSGPEELPIWVFTAPNTRKVTVSGILAAPNPAADITGGTIDNAPIGSATPATGSFTTLEVTAATAHSLVVGEAASPIASVPAGAAGGILASNGVGADPSFKSGASVQGNLGNTSTTSTSGVMSGYGTTIFLTPTYSGKVRVTFNGIISNNTANDIGAVQIHYGTGPAPAAGAALQGIGAGGLIGVVNNANTAGFSVPFPADALITGLSVGTAYWFDLSEISVGSGSTTAVINAYGEATEVP